MSCSQNTPTSAPPVPTVGGEGGAVATADNDTFLVRLETTKGDILIEVHPAWAPIGAAHFRELVESGFYTDCAFFRVIPGFMCQAGVAADPEVNARWSDRTVPDDPVIKSNQRGYVTFGKTNAPHSRSTHIFINYGDNARLDGMTFAPFGIVIEGMDVADSISSQYGERPDQGRMRYEGNTYLKESFPGLDYILKASIVGSETDAVEPVSAKSDSSDSVPAGTSQPSDAQAESSDAETSAADSSSDASATAESD
ncbi:peptidylprolyl isomerase [bacterium]|nr:peptidylprolyl isomerase [bacterium]